MKLFPSLRHLLTINFLMVAIVPIIVIGGISLYSVTTNMQREIADRHFLLARSLSGEVEQFLLEPSGLLRQIAFIVEQQQIIMPGEINAYLDSVLKNYQSFESLWILDTSGKIVHLAPYQEDFLMLDASAQDFFRARADAGAPYWSLTSISLQTGNPTLSVSIPLRQGMLVGFLNLAALHAMTTKMAIGVHGYAAIVDRDGTIIAHPDRSVVAQRDNLGHLELVQHGLRGHEGRMIYHANAAEYIGCAALVETTQWLVIVTQPVDEAFAGVRKMREILGGGILAAGAFALLTALFSLRQTLQPFTELASQAKCIADGDYRLLPIQRHYEEVDELTRSFALMIAAIKSREEALRESEEFLHNIVEYIPNMIFVKDAAELRFVRFNKAGEDLLGYSRDDLLGKNDYDFFPVEQANFFVKKDRDVLERRMFLDIPEETIQTRTLGERILHTKKIPILDNNGNPAYLLGISEDITERKHIEDALNKRILALTEPLETGDVSFHDLFNLEDLQKIQDAFAAAMNVASIITDPNGVPITKPSNFCRLCRDIIRGTEAGRANCFLSDAVIGSQNLAGPTIQPCLSAGLWDAGASITVGGKHLANWLIGQVKNEAIDEQRLLDYAHQIGADEQQFREALRDVPVMSSTQFQRIATVLFLLSNELSLKAYQNVQQARFIAQRKQAEEEVRLLNAELELRVRERTAKLEAANKELRSFAYIISHDLKSPLRAISRLAHWLVNDYALCFDEEAKKIADLLIGRVKRMDDLIDGILAYSRIGQIPTRREAIDLRQRLPEIIASLAPPPGITIHLAPDFPTLVGNPSEVQQIFSHLINNAIKFMDKPQGDIAVTWTDAGEMWQFSVEDNGPGIDPKYHVKIFQIFQTLRPRDEVESAGTGLAIVKKIVELSGGNIWVNSEKGQGSVFIFTLPKERTLE